MALIKIVLCSVTSVDDITDIVFSVDNIKRIEAPIDSTTDKCTMFSR